MCKLRMLAVLVSSLLVGSLVGCTTSTAVGTKGFTDVSPVVVHYVNGDSDYVATIYAHDFCVHQPESPSRTSGLPEIQIEIMDGWIVVEGVKPVIATHDTIAGTEGKLFHVATASATTASSRCRILLAYTASMVDAVVSEDDSIFIVGRGMFDKDPLGVNSGVVKGARPRWYGNVYANPDPVVPAPSLVHPETSANVILINGFINRLGAGSWNDI